MDIQIKRGILDVCVLAALRCEDSYGYKIIKDVPPALGLTESTLYPILKRLEGAGFVTAYTVEHAGRLRKYYRMEQAGQTRIDEFLTEWTDMVEVYEFIRKGAAQ
ncbi:MAG: PadR family transcriptional regulator [Clostridium sp. SCN 57-10]|nr:MAG: PadR family transcriptional regulator [Clostridium sp. SCN 57-10]